VNAVRQTTEVPKPSGARPRVPWDVADRQNIAAPQHAQAKALLKYWRAQSPAGDIPRRDDIAAAQIPRLLPNLLILEPAAECSDWSYRLIGTQVVARYGFDWTGLRVSDIYSTPSAARLIEEYSQAAASRIPSFAIGRLRAPGREHVIYEIAILPIRGRDTEKIWLLLGIFFHN
jgi:hypothetical protein